MSHIVTTQLEEVLTTHLYTNLNDHLKYFTKSELEIIIKVDLRYFYFGRLDTNKYTYSNKK